jgi:hypothetical protein
MKMEPPCPSPPCPAPLLAEDPLFVVEESPELSPPPHAPRAKRPARRDALRIANKGRRFMEKWYARGEGASSASIRADPIQ